MTLKCPSCSDGSCGGCTDGQIIYDSCPMKRLDPRVNEVMRFAGYARDSGMWPVAGGALDQSPAFMAAEALIRNDRAAWRAEMGLPV